MKLGKLSALIITLMIVSLLGCGSTPETATVKLDQMITETAPTLTNQTISTSELISPLTKAVVESLRDRDLQKLENYVHPIQGVRFSPYTYVSDTDLVFKAEDIPSLFDNPNVYLWGVYDGSGKPIDMTFQQYFDRFVYDQDFANANQIGYNQILGSGNLIDNSHDYYPGAVIVEYYFPGFDPDLQGMDWKSLRLVFQELQDQWYLVGVIHSEWTI